MDELHDDELGLIRKSEEEEDFWEAEVTLPSGEALRIEFVSESAEELKTALASTRRVVQAITSDEDQLREQVAVKFAEMFNNQIPPRFKEPLTTEEMARALEMAWLAVHAGTTEIKLYYDVWFAGDHYAILFFEEDGRLGEVGLEG